MELMESRYRKFNVDEQPNAARLKWLTTFNDLMTLLLVFFVLLFAMSRPNTVHLKAFANALQSAMGVLHPGSNAVDGIISDESSNRPQSPRSSAFEKGAESLRPLQDTQGLEAQYTPKGIQLTLNDNLLFSTGSAHLKPQGKALLDKVVRIIAPLNRYVRVEGHTDDVPIETQRYPSNWELSTDRATSVVKYIQKSGQIPPHYLSAAGYGASKPKAENTSDANRSKNRRVEIILQQPAPSNSDI